MQIRASYPLLLAAVLGGLTTTAARSAHAQTVGGPSLPEPRGNLMPEAKTTSGAPPEAAPDPAQDQRKLVAQGEARPDESAITGNPSTIFADDWWGHTRPVLELHGYFRTRGELFHNFALGRLQRPGRREEPLGAPARPLVLHAERHPPRRQALRRRRRTSSANCQDKTQSSAPT
jgi:hypothetical protein